MGSRTEIEACSIAQSPATGRWYAISPDGQVYRWYPYVKKWLPVEHNSGVNAGCVFWHRVCMYSTQRRGIIQLISRG